MSSFEILEIQSALGETKTSPSKLFSDDDGRIQKKTGISKIHRSSLSAFELSLKALHKLKNIDEVQEKTKFVLYVTQSPSYFLPNHASRIQDELNLKQETMCFDINQGCSGFVQALIIMSSLLKQKSDLGLIVCADTYSHHLSDDDRSTQVLFSDGATVSVIKGRGKWRIEGVKHLTDGSGANLLCKSIHSANRLKMDGASVFQWTRRELGSQIKDLLNEKKYDIKEIEGFYLHQASKLVLDNVKKSLSIEDSRIPSTLDLTGNLVSSSIPFLIENNFEKFNSSNFLVMSGFGVGLSSSSCILRKE